MIQTGALCLPGELSVLDKTSTEVMFPVLTNVLVDVTGLVRSELEVTSPWLVAGRSERTADWENGMS